MSLKTSKNSALFNREPGEGAITPMHRVITAKILKASFAMQEPPFVSSNTKAKTPFLTGYCPEVRKQEAVIFENSLDT